MPNIKPISDLRNYGDVLRDVGSGEPVYLTKNGRGKYVLADLQDFEKMHAALELLEKLEEGRLSGEREGYISEEEVERHFKRKLHAALIAEDAERYGK